MAAAGTGKSAGQRALIQRSRNRRLPQIEYSSVKDPAISQALQIITEHLRMYEGDNAAPKERFITIQELEDAGLVSVGIKNGYAYLSQILNKDVAQKAGSTAKPSLKGTIRKDTALGPRTPGGAAGASNPLEQGKRGLIGKLSDIGNVSVQSPAQRDFLYFDGGKWKNFSLFKRQNKWFGRQTLEKSLQLRGLVTGPKALSDYGYLWVQDGDPTTLFFTDSAGTASGILNTTSDFTISGAWTFTTNQKIWLTGGGPADALHLRDDTDTRDLVFRYDGDNWTLRNEGSGGGLELINFDNATGSLFLSSPLFPDTVNSNGITFSNAAGPFGIRWSGEVSTAEDVQLVYRTTPNTLGFERVSDSSMIIEFDPSDLTVNVNGAEISSTLIGQWNTAPHLGTLTQADNYLYLNRNHASNVVLYAAQVGAGPVAQLGKVGTLGSNTFTASCTVLNDASLHLESNGDIGIIIEADKDNSGESDNPYIHFIQDGGAVGGVFGLTGVADDDAMANTFAGAPANSFSMHALASAGIALGAVNTASVLIDSNGIDTTSLSTSVPAIKATNAGTANLIAQFIGDSDSLDIKTIAAGDYVIENSQQNNGIGFYDGTGGVKIKYNNTDYLEFTSSGIVFHATEDVKRSGKGAFVYYDSSTYNAGGKITVSTTAPSSPNTGDIWFDTS